MIIAPPIDIGKFIITKSGVRGGRPYVSGAGVTVRRIISMVYVELRTPEDIVEDMPHLTLASVHAALAYYHANKAQLDAEFAEEEAEEAKIVEEWTQAPKQK